MMPAWPYLLGSGPTLMPSPHHDPGASSASEVWGRWPSASISDFESADKKPLTREPSNSVMMRVKSTADASHPPAPSYIITSQQYGIGTWPSPAKSESTSGKPL